MPSHLRLQAQFEPIAVKAIHQTSPTLPPAKRAKMSLTQTYYVASTARSKLGREANRSDHNLRLLVGHANLLDSLMLELTSAEQEQERWFNESVQKASKPEQPQHITWVDSIPEEDESEGESDDDSDIYDEDADEMFNIPLRKMRSPPVTVSSNEIEDDEFDMDEEYDEEHALARVPSRQQQIHSPPEMVEDDSEDSDSEDESMPSSPDSDTMELSEKDRQVITTTSFYDSKSQQGLEDYIMQQAQQPQAPLIAAY